MGFGGHRCPSTGVGGLALGDGVLISQHKAGVPGCLQGGRGVGLAPLVRSGWGSGLLVCRADFCASLHKKKGRTLVCVLPFLVTLPRGSCA